MTGLQGKVIAVTGAASGIGLAVARLAAAQGAVLALADIQEEPLQKVVEELQASGARVSRSIVNVTSTEMVDDWTRSIIIEYGRLDGAANLAGVEGAARAEGSGGKGPALKDLTDEEWSLVMSVNLTGLMRCVRAQIRVMGAGSSIVNASSVLGLTGRDYMLAYSVSKHGVIGLTKSVAKEVGIHGIRVNAIAP